MNGADFKHMGVDGASCLPRAAARAAPTTARLRAAARRALTPRAFAERKWFAHVIVLLCQYISNTPAFASPGAFPDLLEFVGMIEELFSLPQVRALGRFGHASNRNLSVTGAATAAPASCRVILRHRRLALPPAVLAPRAHSRVVRCCRSCLLASLSGARTAWATASACAPRPRRTASRTRSCGRMCWRSCTAARLSCLSAAASPPSPPPRKCPTWSCRPTSRPRWRLRRMPTHPKPPLQPPRLLRPLLPPLRSCPATRRPTTTPPAARRSRTTPPTARRRRRRWRPAWKATPLPLRHPPPPPRPSRSW